MARSRKTRVTPLGGLVLTAAVGVCVGYVGIWVQRNIPQENPRKEKTLKWETLEGEQGPLLLRTETPHGWLVCSDDDNYLVFVIDPEKSWLPDKD